MAIMGVPSRFTARITMSKSTQPTVRAAMPPASAVPDNCGTITQSGATATTYYMWGFQARADNIKDEFPANPSSWRRQTYNECARYGVDDEVNNIERECSWDDTSQCNDLGNAAAESVAMDSWCSPSEFTHQDLTNWKAICANATVTVCEGNIGNVANRWCRNKSTISRDRRDLQGQCGDQVDDMVGDDDAPSNDMVGDGDAPSKAECVPDERPQIAHSGRFRFRLVESDAQCVDDRGRLYEWGQFSGVKDFGDCAEQCVISTPQVIIDNRTFRGFDFDCQGSLCRCLYDAGSLDRRNAATFERTDRNERGVGSIDRTTRKKATYCGSLVGREFLYDYEAVQKTE